jgi:hypothetical protein
VKFGSLWTDTEQNYIRVHTFITGLQLYQIL